MNHLLPAGFKIEDAVTQGSGKVIGKAVGDVSTRQQPIKGRPEVDYLLGGAGLQNQLPWYAQDGEAKLTPCSAF